ncbi:MAG: PepSY domain-containing protein [Deltaproteobacteria bacterium]
MKKSLLITVVAAVCMLSAGVLSLAHAEEKATGYPEAERVGEAAYEEKHKAEVKGTISLEEAIAIAKKEVPGEVVEAEYERGRYEIKILKDGKITDGRITEIYVDAKDGSIKRK